jgi:hypothetical protein
MKSIEKTKIVIVLFLIGILSTTFFIQPNVLRKKYSLSGYSYEKTWSASSEKSPESDAKKQLPISTNLIAEEEDKIVEEFDHIWSSSHPVLLAKSFSFHHQFFDEPLLTVAGLPPWS